MQSSTQYATIGNFKDSVTYALEPELMHNDPRLHMQPDPFLIYMLLSGM